MMCFDLIYDWYADISEVVEGPKPESATCFECCLPIPAGAWRRHIYQVEHEECTRCEYEELGPNEEPCEACDHGEVFEANICRSCCWLLDAIADVEKAAGCPEHQRQPHYGELAESLLEDARYGDWRYVRRAVAVHPSLVTGKLVRWCREVV